MRVPRLRPSDRAVLALCVTLSVAGGMASPVARALDPELAVAAAFWGPVDPARLVARGGGSVSGQGVAPGSALDPWEAPWCDTWRLAPPLRGGASVYSAGPDGRDELGAGDDVVLSTRSALAHSFLARAWALGLAGAVVVLATWSSARTFPRAAGPRASAVDAVLLGLFALVASLVLTGLATDALSLGAHTAPLLHVDGRIAFLGTCTLAIAAVAVAGRAVSRAAADEARDAPPPVASVDAPDAASAVASVDAAPPTRIPDASVDPGASAQQQALRG